MSTNFIEKGEVLNYSATTKNISSGDLVIIGSIAGVAKTEATESAAALAAR